MEEAVCAACSLRIRDRFMLRALGKLWHEDCLKVSSTSLQHHIHARHPRNRFFCHASFVRALPTVAHETLNLYFNEYAASGGYEPSLNSLSILPQPHFPRSLTRQKFRCFFPELVGEKLVKLCSVIPLAGSHHWLWIIYGLNYSFSHGDCCFNFFYVATLIWKDFIRWRDIVLMPANLYWANACCIVD